MKSFALVLAVAVAVGGMPRTKRESTPDFYNLPSNASAVLGGFVSTGFDCADLPYGYYADTSNNCQVFHVCLPYIDHDQYVTRHFSFLCGEGTVFDQERLVCASAGDALPCDRAPEFTRANEYFGRQDVNFLE